MLKACRVKWIRLWRLYILLFQIMMNKATAVSIWRQLRAYSDGKNAFRRLPNPQLEMFFEFSLKIKCLFTNVFILKLSPHTFSDIYNGLQCKALFNFTCKNFVIFVWIQSLCIRSISFTWIYHNYFLTCKLIMSNYVYNKVTRILQPTSI